MDDGFDSQATTLRNSRSRSRSRSGSGNRGNGGKGNGGKGKGGKGNGVKGNGNDGKGNNSNGNGHVRRGVEHTQEHRWLGFCSTLAMLHRSGHISDPFELFPWRYDFATMEVQLAVPW